MNLRKTAYKNQKLEEDIKRYKIQGLSTFDISEKVGVTPNRVEAILFESLRVSKLRQNDYNRRSKLAGLSGFDFTNISTDFSSLVSLGEAVRKYQEKE